MCGRGRIAGRLQSRRKTALSDFGASLYEAFVHNKFIEKLIFIFTIAGTNPRTRKHAQGHWLTLGAYTTNL